MKDLVNKHLKEAGEMFDALPGEFNIASNAIYIQNNNVDATPNQAIDIANIIIDSRNNRRGY